MNTALMVIPKCREHVVQMVLVNPTTQTPEQRWAGIWYRCPCCTSSTLFPSLALLSQHTEMGGSLLTRQSVTRNRPVVGNPFRAVSESHLIGGSKP